MNSPFIFTECMSITDMCLCSALCSLLPSSQCVTFWLKRSVQCAETRVSITLSVKLYHCRVDGSAVDGAQRRLSPPDGSTARKNTKKGPNARTDVR